MIELCRATVCRTLRYLALGSLVLTSSAWAQVVTIPITFTAGTPAVAADVNANFNAVATAINNNTVGLDFVNAGAFAALTGAEATYRTISVTVPGSGFLVTAASGNSSCNSAGAVFVARLQNATTGAITGSFYDARAGTDFQYYAVHNVFAVTAGTHTLNLRAYCSVVGASAGINVTTFYAFFVGQQF